VMGKFTGKCAAKGCLFCEDSLSARAACWWLAAAAGAARIVCGARRRCTMLEQM
jgi:hypothetical protein